ncbi:MAG: hypothetical protein JWM49_301 [Microbacteriaceae bacterium]|nr:hypothetical protein [Microbacteriaceae bacterium]
MVGSSREAGARPRKCPRCSLERRRGLLSLVALATLVAVAGVARPPVARSARRNRGRRRRRRRRRRDGRRHRGQLGLQIFTNQVDRRLDLSASRRAHRAGRRGIPQGILQGDECAQGAGEVAGRRAVCDSHDLGLKPLRRRSLDAGSGPCTARQRGHAEHHHERQPHPQPETPHGVTVLSSCFRWSPRVPPTAGNDGAGAPVWREFSATATQIAATTITTRMSATRMSQRRLFHR